MNSSKWQSHSVPERNVETVSRFEMQRDEDTKFEGVNRPPLRNRAQRRADARAAARMSKPAGRRRWCQNCNKYHFTTL